MARSSEHLFISAIKIQSEHREDVVNLRVGLRVLHQVSSLVALVVSASGSGDVAPAVATHQSRLVL